MRMMMAGAALAAMGVAMPAMALPADFKAKADEIVTAAFPATGPGASVVVFDHGKPVYESARGMADIAKGQKLTAETPMRIASTSKQFTAAMIMQLVEEGRINLDDPLSKFLPDYPGEGAKATVRQLLNHSSGIKSYTAIPGFVLGRSAEKFTTQQLIDVFKNEPLDFPVGTGWQYNNSGYVLLGAIIEKVTGKSWATNIDERIARPLGLTSLRYASTGIGDDGVAAGYRVGPDGTAIVAPPLDKSVPFAAGGLVISAHDLGRWIEALNTGKVVSPASYKAMTTPIALKGDGIPPYGFGLFMGEVRGHPFVGHGGDMFGFRTDSFYLTDDGLAVAVIANDERPAIAPDAVTRRLAALAIGKPYDTFVKAPLDMKRVESLLGVYKAGENERLLFLHQGKLHTKRNGGQPFEVTPATDGRFFYGDSLSWFALGTDKGGTKTMDFHSDGIDKGEVMTWTGPVPPKAPTFDVPRAQLDRFVGNYIGPAPIVVAVDGQGQLTLKFGPSEPTVLVAEAPTLFRADEEDAKVRFDADGGKVTGLVIMQGGQELKAARAD